MSDQMLLVASLAGLFIGVAGLLAAEFTARKRARQLALHETPPAE